MDNQQTLKMTALALDEARNAIAEGLAERLSVAPDTFPVPLPRGRYDGETLSLQGVGMWFAYALWRGDHWAIEYVGDWFADLSWLQDAPGLDE